MPPSAAVALGSDIRQTWCGILRAPLPYQQVASGNLLTSLILSVFFCEIRLMLNLLPGIVVGLEWDKKTEGQPLDKCAIY